MKSEEIRASAAERRASFDRDPRKLPPDLLASIGLMATSAAMTENIVEIAVAGFLRVSTDYGLTLTPHMNMPLRLDVLKSAAEIRIDDLDVLDEFGELLGRIKEAFGKRNDVIHDLWFRNSHTGEVGRYQKKARGKLEMKFITTSADEVRRDALLVHEVGMELATFLRRHNLWPRKQRVRPSPLWFKRAARKEREKKKGRDRI
jgi:hypothetical protein